MEFFSLTADPAVAFLMSLLQFEHHSSQAFRAIEPQKIYTCNAWSYEMTVDPNEASSPQPTNPARLYCEKDS